MSKSGAALLEVIIAITLLSVAGLNVAVVVSRAGHTLETGRQAEIEVREASRFMQAVALWPREDLNRRLGKRQQGSWYLRIDRISDHLFELELTTADSITLVHTAVFRPR